MTTICKADLVQRVSRHVQATPMVVQYILDTILDEIAEALTRGNRVTLNYFGTFDPHPSSTQRKAGQHREKPSSPEQYTLDFRASAALKRRVREGGDG